MQIANFGGNQLFSKLSLRAPCHIFVQLQFLAFFLLTHCAVRAEDEQIQGSPTYAIWTNAIFCSVALSCVHLAYTVQCGRKARQIYWSSWNLTHYWSLEFIISLLYYLIYSYAEENVCQDSLKSQSFYVNVSDLKMGLDIHITMQEVAKTLLV